MDEVKNRTRVIQGFLEGKINAIYPATTIECAALQLRKIMELIALGSLVANREEYANNYEKFARHYHAEKILRDIEKINPCFYPKPIKEVPSKRAGVKMDITNVENGFLTRNDFVSTYNALGEILHAKNPFALQTDYGRFKDLIKEAIGKTIVLLKAHEVQLLNGNLLLVHMEEARDKRVHAYVFEPEENEPTDT